MVMVAAGIVLAAYPGTALGAAQSAVGHGHAPDVSIRYVGAKSVLGTLIQPGAWVGGHVRNGTADHQTLSERLAGASPKGAQYMFELKIRNPGAARSFAVRTSGKGSWQVTYSVGKKDITAAVVAGTYRTPLLAHGATFVVTIKARLGRPGTSFARLVRVSSATNSSLVDAVRLRINYSAGCGC